MATKKIKAPAAVVAIPQTREECAKFIKLLGDEKRQFEQSRAEMNAALSDITQSFQPVLAASEKRAQELQAGIQAWCEANRATLCQSGLKSASLVTGEVAWRQLPPSVTVRGADSVIETLERMGLGRFVRIKSEVNKEAILNDPDAVRGIAGITVVTGLETFSITPFEADAEIKWLPVAGGAQ